MTHKAAAYGWGLKYPKTDILAHKLFDTRKGVISYYNSVYGSPQAYRRAQRRGDVLAVRVKLVEAFMEAE